MTIIPFYRGGNWGTEILNSLFKVTVSKWQGWDSNCNSPASQAEQVIPLIPLYLFQWVILSNSSLRLQYPNCIHPHTKILHSVPSSGTSLITSLKTLSSPNPAWILGYFVLWLSFWILWSFDFLKVQPFAQTVLCVFSPNPRPLSPTGDNCEPNEMSLITNYAWQPQVGPSYSNSSLCFPLYTPFLISPLWHSFFF